MLRRIFLTLFITLLSLSLYAEETSKQEVGEFLVLGPVNVTLPVGGSEDDLTSFIKEDPFGVADWWPSQNDLTTFYSNETLTWEKQNSELDFTRSEGNTVFFAGFYVEVEHWSKVNIEFETCGMTAVYINGEKKTDKTDVDEDECDNISVDAELERGKHFVLAKLLFNPDKNDNWNFSASMKTENEAAISTDPLRYTTVSDLLDNKKVSSISISPNGSFVAIGYKERNEVKDDFDNWIQIHTVNNGNLVWSFKGAMSVPEVDWAPDSESFAYTVASGETKSLWIVNAKTGESEALLQNVKDMGGFSWAPNGEYIVYTKSEKAEDDDPNFKKYDLPEDRLPGFRNKTSLHRVFVNSKMTQQLMKPDQKFSFVEISPDSKKILYSKTYYGEEKRPYFRSDYHILDLEETKSDSVLSLHYATGASWAPDSKQLLILGGSTTFGSEGNTLPENVIPNDYDTQAYIYDITSGDVEVITRDFNPQISSAEWDGNNNVIYFSTTDQSYKRLYKYEISTKKFAMIDLGVESLGTIDYAEDFSVAVFEGSSSNVPNKVYKLNLENAGVSLFADPESEEYSDIKLGEVKDWDFTSGAGQKIKGRVYYPPTFDASKKYPAIIYYYAGTSPVTREFEGRYPKNYWAANGYVIYVLQPSGATGFGTEFSAKHVNDWGETTAKEIIEGTKKFLDAHEFVDPDRIGCIGASYGGFETMSLITKTDMFSAAISHAGISNLTSYWGVGYWGYWYNTIAAAESFPWNRKDIYVEKSPLFNADKINTPLLLLHGNTDPNVPPGESMQMYVALKHLGKDVELIEVDQQQHWILQYDKRTKWSKTIVAYFDKYLKDQPEWIESLYK